MLISMYGDQCQIARYGVIVFCYQASEFCC